MAGNTFGRTRRLLTAADFKGVFDNARYRASTPRFLILANDNSLGGSRLGVVIAKKNVRRAVDRNRLKRLVRESFRSRAEDLGSIDAVLVARRGFDQDENLQVLDNLQHQWRKITRQASGKRKSASATATPESPTKAPS